MLIMGIDPGSRTTGWGVVSLEGNRLRCVDYGTIMAARGPNPPTMPERLRVIFDKVDSALKKYSPDVVAVEGVFYAVNVKSALTLGHVRGVILLAAAKNETPLVEFSPLEVKKSVVGYGRADKKQVQAMVSRLLGLKEEPEPHDAADALALALCQAFNGSNQRRKQRRWRAYEVE